MNFCWIFSILLLFQQVHFPDSLTITKNGQTISIINRTDFSSALPDFPIINQKKYNRLLNSLSNQVYMEPKNALIDRHGNIITEQVGYKLYRKAFMADFYTYYFNNGPAKFEIPLLAIYPRVDSELLADIRSERIGRYVTSFNVGNKTRSHNIRLAVRAINNAVVFPGETFSFNKVVGKRTASKGYLKAPVIIRGELSEDFGGGICQVSSTLFNAVDNAGLQIVQRFSHSREVPYIPPGRDATVSWYGPDFVFKNKYNQPILLQAKTLGNKLIIKVFSSEVINYKPRIVPNPK
jgi:vancomycin resistance protein YoaR